MTRCCFKLISFSVCSHLFSVATNNHTKKGIVLTLKPAGQKCIILNFANPHPLFTILLSCNVYIYWYFQIFVSPSYPLLTETLHANKSEQIKETTLRAFGWKNPNVPLPPLSPSCHFIHWRELQGQWFKNCGITYIAIFKFIIKKILLFVLYSI